jgi:hypothetical protein
MCLLLLIFVYFHSAVVKAGKEQPRKSNPLNFFLKEYQLNHLLGSCRKPVISFLDGITSAPLFAPLYFTHCHCLCFRVVKAGLLLPVAFFFFLPLSHVACVFVCLFICFNQMCMCVSSGRRRGHLNPRHLSCCH